MDKTEKISKKMKEDCKNGICESCEYKAICNFIISPYIYNQGNYNEYFNRKIKELKKCIKKIEELENKCI